MRGFTGGVQGGRRWQFDNSIVVGVEGTLSFGNVTRDWKDREQHQYSPYYGEDALTRSGTLDVTLGRAMGRWSPYVGAGVTVAQQEFTLGCDKSLVEATNGCRVAEFETRASHLPPAPTPPQACCTASTSASRPVPNTATPTWVPARRPWKTPTTLLRRVAASIPTTAALR